MLARQAAPVWQLTLLVLVYFVAGKCSSRWDSLLILSA